MHHQIQLSPLLAGNVCGTILKAYAWCKDSTLNSCSSAEVESSTTCTELTSSSSQPLTRSVTEDTVHESRLQQATRLLHPQPVTAWQLRSYSKSSSLFLLEKILLTRPETAENCTQLMHVSATLCAGSTGKSQYSTQAHHEEASDDIEEAATQPETTAVPIAEAGEHADASAVAAHHGQAAAQGGCAHVVVVVCRAAAPRRVSTATG